MGKKTSSHNRMSSNNKCGVLLLFVYRFQTCACTYISNLSRSVLFLFFCLHVPSVYLTGSVPLQGSKNFILYLKGTIWTR